MKQLLVLFSLVVYGFANGQSENALTLVQTFHISSPGGWDYIAVNKNRVYVSHSTQVNILDKLTGDSLGYIPNTTGVHGIAFDNSLNRGYTSNGRLNNVTVFDLTTNDTITHIATGENPDAILYEPFSKTIITCNGRSKDLSVIDPAQNKLIATIPVGGKPEAAAFDGKGKLFVNVEDKNEIVAIDMKNYTVSAHWTLAPGDGPSGLAMDVASNRLFSTCDKLLVVVDATSGKIIDKLLIGDGTDGVVFDDATKTIYTSNGEGTITAVKEVSADKYAILGNYKSKRGARTIAIDANSRNLFLPTAELEASNGGGRPKMIAGTFQVLVVKY
jgi:YVTN family beta-propeller protein